MITFERRRRRPRSARGDLNGSPSNSAENLARWGYPYVGADYKFHMTLSGMLERPAEVADALARMYMERVGSAHLVVDALVLFAQKEPGARFKIIDRAPLALQRDTGTVR